MLYYILSSDAVQWKQTFNRFGQSEMLRMRNAANEIKMLTAKRRLIGAIATPSPAERGEVVVEVGGWGAAGPHDTAPASEANSHGCLTVGL